MIDKILGLIGALQSVYNSVIGRVEKKQAKVDGAIQQQLMQAEKDGEEQRNALKARLDSIGADYDDPSISRYKRKTKPNKKQKPKSKSQSD